MVHNDVSQHHELVLGKEASVASVKLIHNLLRRHMLVVRLVEDATHTTRHNKTEKKMRISVHTLSVLYYTPYAD